MSHHPNRRRFIQSAAALALDAKTSVQAVDYAALRTRLLAAGQKLIWTPPAKPEAKKK